MIGKRSHRSPKRFAPPRSRAAREAADPVVPPTMQELARIMRDLYPYSGRPARPEMVKPQWALTALKFGWMVRGQFNRVKDVLTGRILPAEPSLRELMMRPSPMLGLIAKRPA